MPALVVNPDEIAEDPRPGLDLACALCVEQVEIRTVWGRNAVMASEYDLDWLGNELDVRGLRVAALAAPLWKWCVPEARPDRVDARVDAFGFPTRVARHDRLAWVERALTVARRVGTRRVRVFSHLRVQPEYTESLLGDPQFEQALDLAEQAGVRLLLENEPVCTTASVEAVQAVLEHYGGRLRLWWDVANAVELGEDSLAATTLLGDHIGYVHIKDYWRDSCGSRQFCPAGSGDVPYPPVLAALRDCAPQAPWALETHVRHETRAALHESVAFLRSQQAVG